MATERPVVSTPVRDVTLYADAVSIAGSAAATSGIGTEQRGRSAGSCAERRSAGKAMELMSGAAVPMRTAAF